MAGSPRWLVAAVIIVLLIVIAGIVFMIPIYGD
jgi:hypothetical protein